MSQSRKFRIALIGAGMVSDAHARSIGELPNAELAIVYSRTAERAQAFAKRYNCDWTTDLDQALGRDGVDIAIITTAPYVHADQAIAAMQAGKHVLVEKPMAISSAQCDQIAAASKKCNRKFAVVHQTRCKKAVQLVKQFVEAGKLGQLLHVSGYVKWYRPPSYYQANDWRGRTDLEGGGVIFSQAGHTLDLMQWIAGPVAWVFTNMVTAPVHQDLEIENLATVTLRFTNGATGMLEASTALYPGAAERLELHGSRGTIVLDGGQITCWKIRDAGKNDQVGDWQEAAGSGAADPMAFPITWHKQVIADFLDAIEYDRPPMVDAAQGRVMIDLCQKIYQSARELGVVRLDEKTSPVQQ